MERKAKTNDDYQETLQRLVNEAWDNPDLKIIEDKRNSGNLGPDFLMGYLIESPFEMELNGELIMDKRYVSGRIHQFKQFPSNIGVECYNPKELGNWIAFASLYEQTFGKDVTIITKF